MGKQHPTRLQKIIIIIDSRVKNRVGNGLFTQKEALPDHLRRQMSISLRAKNKVVITVMRSYYDNSVVMRQPLQSYCHPNKTAAE